MENRYGQAHRGPELATNVVRGLRSLSYEGRRENCSTLMWRPYAQTMFQYLKGGYEGGDLFFTRCHIEKTRDNGCKLHLGKFSLDVRGKFFTMRTIIRWNNPITLPGKLWTTKTDTFKIELGCWAILFRLWYCQERLGQIILVVPSNLVFYDSIRYVCVYVYAFYN